MSERTLIQLPLCREEIDVKLQGIDGQTKEYVLIELDGTARDEYLTDMSKRMKTVNGQTEIKDYKGLQAQLICMCMRNKANNEQVEINDCQTFPGKTITKLFEACQKLNGLDSDASKTAKND